MSLAAVGAVVVGASCYDATEIVLEIHSDACNAEATRNAQVLVFVGPTLDQATTSPTSVAEVPSCGAGRQGDVVGTLALVPSDGADSDALVGIEVVEGNGCVGADGKRRSADCVYARRGVRFQTHRTVRIPIFLRGVCRGKICPNDQTCNEQGQCVGASCGSDCNAVEPPPDADGGKPGPGPDATKGDRVPTGDVTITPVDGSRVCGRPGIACGAGSCAVGVEKCCDDACTSADPTCTFDVACDDGFDCAPGGTCCATVTGSGSAAAAVARCVGTGSPCSGVVLCGGDCDCPGRECLSVQCSNKMVRTCGGECPRP